VKTDLLNVLSKIRGFGQDQNQPSGAITDPTSDATKHGAGYVNTDHAAKTALKDILKPHD